MKRSTKYQNRLRGSASSELSKIWARQEGRMSSASVPTKVPKVKTTYPLTKLVASKTSLCKTLTNPNETEAMRIEDKISRWFSLSEKNIKNPRPAARIRAGCPGLRDAGASLLQSGPLRVLPVSLRKFSLIHSIFQLSIESQPAHQPSLGYSANTRNSKFPGPKRRWRRSTMVWT